MNGKFESSLTCSITSLKYIKTNLGQCDQTFISIGMRGDTKNCMVTCHSNFTGLAMPGSTVDPSMGSEVVWTCKRFGYKKQ